MSVGRNDACPCGSGKKFKRCCDAPPPPRDLTPHDLLYKKLRLLVGEHREAMRRFVDREYGVELIDIAWRAFSEPGLELELNVPVDFDPATPLADLFLRWFEHHWKPAPEDELELDSDILALSPTGVFLSRKAAAIDPLLRQYLERCVASHATFFEVIDVHRDYGITVCEVTGGSKRFVHYADISRLAAIHDVLYAHIVSVDTIHVIEALPPLALRPSTRTELVARLAALAKEHACSLNQLAATRETDLRDLFLEFLADHIEGEAGRISLVED
jgi:hypothetical protein